MNYMPPDPTRQTSCKNCIFAIYDGNTQKGCQDNRIEKFGDFVIEAYDDSKEFYVINRLCNLYRNSNWNNGEIDVSKAKLESCLTFDILINCTDIDDNYKDKIISELDKLDYPHKKCNILLFQSYKCGQVYRERLFNIHAVHNIANISICLDENEFIYTYVSKAKNSFHIVLDKNNIDDFSLFVNKINELVNNDLKRFILCKNGNKIAISNMACRIKYLDLYLDYENNITIVENDTKKENLYIEI